MTAPAFTIGEVTCYCPADCRDVLPSLEVGSIDAVVTSPPYNQMASVTKGKPSGLWAKSHGGAGFVEAWKDSGYEDSQDEEAYQGEQLEVFGAISSRCSDTASLFYNHQIRWRDRVCLHPIRWFQPVGWSLRQEIIWDRAGGMMLNARMFCRFDERILWLTRGQTWKWNQKSVGHGTIWKIARAQHKAHPVAFPLEIPSRCILATTDPGDLVCDPYAGSGTTGVAAAKSGRRCILIEREAKYLEVIRKRLQEAATPLLEGCA